MEFYIPSLRRTSTSTDSDEDYVRYKMILEEQKKGLSERKRQLSEEESKNDEGAPRDDRTISQENPESQQEHQQESPVRYSYIVETDRLRRKKGIKIGFTKNSVVFANKYMRHFIDSRDNFHDYFKLRNENFVLSNLCAHFFRFISSLIYNII